MMSKYTILRLRNELHIDEIKVKTKKRNVKKKLIFKRKPNA